MEVHHLTDLYVGKQTPALQLPVAKDAPGDCCLSVLGYEHGLDLEADSVERAKEWIEGLAFLMRASRQEINDLVNLTKPPEEIAEPWSLRKDGWDDDKIIPLLKGRNFKVYNKVVGDAQEVKKFDAFVFLHPSNGRLGSFHVCISGRRILQEEAECLPLHLVSDIFGGKQGDVLMHPAAKAARGSRCFALGDKKNEKYIYAEAQNKEDMLTWINGTHHILTQGGKRRQKNQDNGLSFEEMGGDLTQSLVFKFATSGTVEELQKAIEAEKPGKETLDVSLLRAVIDGNAMKVIILLRKGASVHKADMGMTPLHRCLSYAEMSELSEIEPIVRLLLAAGANKDARDDDNKTPREYCPQHLLDRGLEEAFMESRTFEEVAKDLEQDAATWLSH
jgi:hypothetical protein